MAEHGFIAAGEDGGVASSIIGEARVSDRVDPTVDPPQPTCLEGARNVALRKPELTQLPERHDSVLSFRQLGQGAMRTHFSPHTGDKGVRCLNSPPGNICSSV